MRIQKDSIAHHTLAFLFSARNSSSYKRMLRSDPNRIISNSSLSVTLLRLRKNDFVLKDSEGWRITDKGIGEVRRVSNLYITSPFNPKSLKNTIVAFDIPEGDRKIRNWTRNQLKIFSYNMLQQSLWFGPGPLPKEFIDRLKTLGIKKNVKIFSIKQN